MNKLSYLMMGFAALSFAACSSDEPTPAPTPGEGEGTTMYLNVNITDANSARSRAEGDEFYDKDGNKINEPQKPAEGDYGFGTGTEHEVNSADFFFFDAAGRYVTRANVWKNGGGNQAPNIEYMGANTLVLRNLSKKNLPVYVITVLNAPNDFAGQVEAGNWTMDQLRQRSFNYLTGSNFVMSTTSFYDATDTDRYDNAHYYATKLKTSDFMTEAPSADAIRDNAVKIYVERLAAKFQLTGVDKDGKFPIDITIAGDENDNNGNVEVGGTPSGSTCVYVKILGYGLTGQEATSSLSKNLDGFTTTEGAATTPWKGWNHADFYRSYWGKSFGYENNAKLVYSTFAQAQNNPSTPIYGYETSREYTAIRNESDKSLKASLVTNMLITAKVYEDEACQKPLDLVEYNGVYFKKDQYMTYVLGKLIAAEGLQYWTNETEVKVGDSYVNDKGETVIATEITWTYSPLTIDDFTCDWSAADKGTGTIVVSYVPKNPEMKFYKKGTNYKEGDRLENVPFADAVAAINKELADFNASSDAVAFNGGAMYYNVPIEHLNGRNQSTNYKVDAEGEYGTVRNHWYQIKVNKVISLGQGVFRPTDMEGGIKAEEIIPNDNKDEKYALATQINILSWKIVQQNVDL